MEGAQKEKAGQEIGSLSLAIREIPKEQAVGLIRCYHYSKIMPRLTRYYLGFYRNGQFSGAVTLGWGTQPLQTIRKIFPRHTLQTVDYLEIGKMCFIPAMNGNRYFGSQALSLLVRWMKNYTGCRFLYTLADGIMGKCGYVYQAANFRYLGSFTSSVYRSRVTGEKIHPRSARLLLEENAFLDGTAKKHWLTHAYCEYKGIEKINGRMFRYIYPLGGGAEKILGEYPEYQALVFPKEKELFFSIRIAPGVYKPIPQPVFNRNICQFNSQKC